MVNYEIMYLKDGVNINYELIDWVGKGDYHLHEMCLYYAVKITKPPERNTDYLILFVDSLELINKIKQVTIQLTSTKYHYIVLRIFFESYKNSKNVYDKTLKFVYFTNVTDEVKKFFSSEYCDSSSLCFNIKRRKIFDTSPKEYIDYGFRINYFLNDLKYLDNLKNSYETPDYFNINSYINVDGIFFFIVFTAAVDWETTKYISQNLVELQNYLNPIVEVGYKELIEKVKLNDKYKQLLYLTVLIDDL